MKCNKCFFCVSFGAGIYAPYPVKYCRRLKKYIEPFLIDTRGQKVPLDLRSIKDLEIWHNAGCSVHPQTVAKAKRDFIRSLEKEGEG